MGNYKVEKQEKVFLKSENCICKCTRHERTKYFLVTTRCVSIVRAKNKSKGIWCFGLGVSKMPPPFK